MESSFLIAKNSFISVISQNNKKKKEENKGSVEFQVFGVQIILGKGQWLLAYLSKKNTVCC
ncbi:unnamed protein product [Spirodela intermedia]|uniref:Uncharacterized protein n=2 Tax=Spirodela intermedia TaxID=51605 RepID=A0A7I8JU29_SPIIN|nr:unnamed protein product [Spirodela intermedia]CAA6673690.1 unnamed protein product [Spirodela intermedia]CAA7410930.1 unnamed protein product [Spirodela intermedia]